MKLFLLANDDLTTSLIFAPLLDSPAVEIVGLAHTATVAGGRTGLFGGALRLLRKMAIGYWCYLVFINGCYKLHDGLARLLGRTRRHGPLVSLRQRCRRRGVPIHRVADFGSQAFHDVLRASGAELLVIRVNQILTPATLAIPARGTWCVHSSLLPAYRGIAGEFHALRRGERLLGTTIFHVEPELDRGPPLFQTAHATEQGGSVFAHMVRNNLAAGAMLRSAVERLSLASGVEPCLVGSPPAASYFSWPRREQLRELHRRGHSLITLGEALRLCISVCGASAAWPTPAPLPAADPCRPHFVDRDRRVAS